jgi:hypothetical protein
MRGPTALCGPEQPQRRSAESTNARRDERQANGGDQASHQVGLDYRCSTRILPQGHESQTPD